MVYAHPELASDAYKELLESFYPETDFSLVKARCGENYKWILPDKKLSNDQAEEELNKLYKERLVICARAAFIEMTYSEKPLRSLLVTLSRMRLAGISWAEILPTKKKLSNKRARAVVKRVFTERYKTPGDVDAASCERHPEIDEMVVEQLNFIKKLCKKPSLLSDIAPEDQRVSDKFERYVRVARLFLSKEEIFKRHVDCPPFRPWHTVPKEAQACAL